MAAGLAPEADQDVSLGIGLRQPRHDGVAESRWQRRRILSVWRDETPREKSGAQPVRLALRGEREQICSRYPAAVNLIGADANGERFLRGGRGGEANAREVEVNLECLIAGGARRGGSNVSTECPLTKIEERRVSDANRKCRDARTTELGPNELQHRERTIRRCGRSVSLPEIEELGRGWSLHPHVGSLKVGSGCSVTVWSRIQPSFSILTC